MSDNVSRYTVTICGSSYTLVTNESKEHIDQSVKMLEDIANGVRKRSAHISVSDIKIIVLAGLQLADRLIKSEKSLRELQQKECALIQMIDAELFSEL